MKIKLLSSIILSVVILSMFGGVVLAKQVQKCMTMDACKALPGYIQTIDTDTCAAPNTTLCSYDDGSSVNPTPAPTRTLNTGSQGPVEIPNPLKTNSIAELIDRIISYVIGIATVIFPLIIIFGAFQFLTAGGDMEKITTARKTLMYAIIGYILILISKGITMIVADLLGAK